MSKSVCDVFWVACYVGLLCVCVGRVWMVSDEWAVCDECV